MISIVLQHLYTENYHKPIYRPMRNIYTLCLLLICSNLFAQKWIDTKKSASEMPNFNEEKAMYHDFCQENNVKNGYFYKNGKKEKLAGWKQFKRSEYIWDYNMNPTNGDFPEYNQYLFPKNTLKDGSNANWQLIGPSSTDGGYAGVGRVNVIAFHPTNDDVIFLGTPAGGLWKTSTGGNDWEPLTDQIASIGVSNIIVSNNFEEDQTIYIGTGDRDHRYSPSIGVLKSVDGGQTWEPTELTFSTSEGAKIYKMLLHPTNNDILYAATSSGLYKSTNAGTNWDHISEIVFNDIEFKADDPQVIFGGTSGYDNVAIYKSTNGGENWNNVLNETGRRVALAVSEDEPDYVYAIIAYNGGGLNGIFKSTNAGASYERLLDGDDYGSALLNWSCEGDGDNDGQGWYDLTICANPQNANEVHIGGVNAWKTSNGGIDWECVNHWVGDCGLPTVHADKHDMVYQKSTNTLFEGNDGGIYKKSVNGNEWTDLSQTLAISQIYKIGMSQTEEMECINGLQDNGTKMVSGTEWYDVLGGDGMECMIDYTDSDVQYGSLYFGTIYKTEDKWQTEEYFTPYDASKGDWVTPFIMSPHNPNTVYAGYNKLWKKPDVNSQWKTVSNGNDVNINAICISATNKNMLVYARQTEIYKTINDGSSWENITSNLPLDYNKINHITISAHNPNTIWVAISGYDADGVYQTIDGGDSWTNISEGLPEVPINCVVQDIRDESSNELFAATDFGVYYKNGDNAWKSFNANLPNTRISELEISYKDQNASLFAATYGRGLWSTVIPTEPTNVEQVVLEKDNIWPNPCNHSVCVRLEQGDEMIQIYDIEGRLVYNNNNPEPITIIATIDWKEGPYIIKKSGKNGGSMTKCIVTH